MCCYIACTTAPNWSRGSPRSETAWVWDSKAVGLGEMGNLLEDVDSLSSVETLVVDIPRQTFFIKQLTCMYTYIYVRVMFIQDTVVKYTIFMQPFQCGFVWLHDWSRKPFWCYNGCDEWCFYMTDISTNVNLSQLCVYFVLWFLCPTYEKVIVLSVCWLLFCHMQANRYMLCVWSTRESCLSAFTGSILCNST